MEIDAAAWSGDGSFTQVLIDALREVEGVQRIRVEDAPSSRTDTGYNFIANEIFVRFEEQVVAVPGRVLGLIPMTRRRAVPALTIGALGRILASRERIGAADYQDDGMIQYLRTERIVPPYQTRGIKVIELVRIYRADAPASKAQ